MLGLGDVAGDREGGSVGGGGGWKLQQRHEWLLKKHKVTSSARKCFLLWKISMLSGAWKKEGTGKNESI